MTWQSSLPKEDASGDHWHQIYGGLFWRDDPIVGNPVSDIAQQKLGVDRLVISRNRRWKCQEKNRPGRQLSDVLIEFAHERADHSTQGWIERPSSAEIFVYACHNDSRAFCCMYPALVQAWRDNRTRWLDKYRNNAHRSTENNDGYATLFCPVPLTVLLRCLGNSAKVIAWTHWEWVRDYERGENRLGSAFRGEVAA